MKSIVERKKSKFMQDRRVAESAEVEMQTESKPANPVWEKFAHALLATTCLSVGASGVSSATTILVVEGISPAPSDFANSSPGFLLAVGTNTVQGTLHQTTDTSDWFEFQSLAGGTAYSILGKYNPLGQERGVSYKVFNTTGTQIGSATLEGEGGLVAGTIPGDGKLIVDVQFAQAGNPTYQFSLNAEIATPEPAPWIGTGLALAGTLAWRRKRRAELI